jgi:hypothetical protein
MPRNVERKYKTDGKPVKQKPTMRPCLKCDRQFLSTGPGNRLCQHCGRNNASASLPWGDGITPFRLIAGRS